jgi:hypothetical protein
LLRNSVTKTAVLPSTITANSTHNTVNCSVWKGAKRNSHLISSSNLRDFIFKRLYFFHRILTFENNDV